MLSIGAKSRPEIGVVIAMYILDKIVTFLWDMNNVILLFPVDINHHLAPKLSRKVTIRVRGIDGSPVLLFAATREGCSANSFLKTGGVCECDLVNGIMNVSSIGEDFHCFGDYFIESIVFVETSNDVYTVLPKEDPLG